MTAKKEKAKKKKDSPGESFRTLIWALAIALIIRTFFFQAFRIPSGSMEDTLVEGDFLLVDKLTFGAKIPGLDARFPGFREPKRGDIIVFKDPRTNRDYIKRCIATEGELIEIVDNAVFINEQPLDEPYKAIKPRPFDVRHTINPHRVSNGSVFMMGDNRNNSEDSRYWGDLNRDKIVGRAFVLYWSTDPSKAPQWVRDMDETWVKGLLQLFLGRPRISRFGQWLAKDYTETYEAGFAEPRAAVDSEDTPAAALAAGGTVALGGASAR